jgi:hypothetical protein
MRGAGAYQHSTSGPHRTSLEALAEECPYEYGHGVHMARAMLSRFDSIPYLDVHACEAPPPPPSAKMGEEESGDDDAASAAGQGGILVYPNPTNGDVHISLVLKDGEVSELTIRDVVGAEVANVRMRDGLNTVSTSSLRQGLYLFTISVNGERRLTVRQVVLK